MTIARKLFTLPSARRRQQIWRAIYNKDNYRWGMLPSLTAHLALDAIYASSTAGHNRVIDVGCGYGRDLALFTSLFPQATLHGVDIALPAVRKAQGLLPHANILATDLLKYQATQPFDVVFSNYFVHLFVNDEITTVFAGLASLVAPGGVLISSFVSQRDRHFGTGSPLNASRTAYEVYPGVPWSFFTHIDIRRLTTAQGLRIESLHHFHEVEFVDGQPDAVAAYFLQARRYA